jgi:hypothetical protein
LSERENGTDTGADLLACGRCSAAVPAQAPVGGAGYRWGRCAVCGYVTYDPPGETI